jgi:DNA polymerase-1
METLNIVSTLDQLKDLEQYLADKDLVAFDTETDGVGKESRIIGFSVCSEIEVAYYVILYKWDGEKLVALETNDRAKEIIQTLAGKRLIMHNAVFDCAMVRNNYKIDLMPSVHTDTMILGHVLDENRENGLKERAVELYGESSREEQKAMKASIVANGGKADKGNYELYKADANLIAHYGAKDAILTLKIFYNDVEKLYEEGLDKFFYEEESMPLLRGPTYDLNTTGLKVDPNRLKTLKAELEGDIIQAKNFILTEIEKHVKDKYPGTNKKNQFNIGSNQQLAWLLFYHLNNEFGTLTKVGKEVCKFFNMRLPYSRGAKTEFITQCITHKGVVWKPGFTDANGKKTKDKLIEDPWKYLECGVEVLTKYADKYKWVEKLLEYKKNLKLLNTYVEGIEERMKYNTIYPSFLQHGTTSGRYSSRNPNFQNLPREDKRVKSCIVSRPGKVFVGADYSQLEPRVFASLSQDEKLMKCFSSSDDFYSTIGVEVFDRYECSLRKDDSDSFAKQYPQERHCSKTIALAATYGATANRLARSTGKSVEDTQVILDAYFDKFPAVKSMMLESHEQAKSTGKVYSLFGRPRRMPEAQLIGKLFGKVTHEELPYEYRNLLNLSVNHRIQSTAASIMNRAGIALAQSREELAHSNALWREVKIVLQVHDELILEGPEELEADMIELLKYCMESTVDLPGVALVAEPKAAKNLADLK